jgi:hypothetical protein
MAILYIKNKINYVTNIKTFYVYRQTKNCTQINDKSAVSENRLFEVIVLTCVAIEGTGVFHTVPVNVAYASLNASAFQMVRVS